MVSQQHDKPIQSHTHATSGWHAIFQGSDKVIIHRHLQTQHLACKSDGAQSAFRTKLLEYMLHIAEEVACELQSCCLNQQKLYRLI